MTKAALIVFEKAGGHSSRGRVFNALEATKEFQENDDDVKLIFDGAGTEWIPELEDESHDFHGLYQNVRADAGVCDFCAGAFGVGDAVDAAGVDRLDEYEGHPSVRSLVAEGYEVLTF